MSYTRDQVSEALNRACDEVQQLVREGGVLDAELPIDATNLVVNAGLYFLDHPEAPMGDVIREHYDDADVLSWFGVGDPP